MWPSLACFHSLERPEACACAVTEIERNVAPKLVAGRFPPVPVVCPRLGGLRQAHWLARRLFGLGPIFRRRRREARRKVSCRNRAKERRHLLSCHDVDLLADLHVQASCAWSKPCRTATAQRRTPGFEAAFGAGRASGSLKEGHEGHLAARGSLPWVWASRAEGRRRNPPRGATRLRGREVGGKGPGAPHVYWRPRPAHTGATVFVMVTLRRW